MTTNTTSTQSTHNATTGTHTSPAPGKFDKGRSFIAEHLFTIYLIVVVILAGVVFTARGLAGNAFTYDDEIPVIVFVYGIAIMAYPAVLAIMAIKNKNGRFAWLRLAIIAASLIYTATLFVFQVRASGKDASVAWSITFLGPVILPLAAIIVHAVAAYLLTRYGPKGSDAAAQDKAKIAGIEANITSAETDFSGAKTSAAAYTEAEEDAKKEFEEADGISKARAEEYKEAKKIFDETSAVRGQADIKEKIKANDRFQHDTATAIETKEARLSQTNAPSVKSLLQDEIDSLNGQLSEFRIKAIELAEELETTKESVDALPEKKAMDDALAASEAAEAITNAAKQEYDAAIDAAKEPRRSMEVNGKIVEQHELQLKETNARIAEASLSQRGAWRSVVFGPLACLIVAFVLYPVWYGWVLSSFPLIPIG